MTADTTMNRTSNSAPRADDEVACCASRNTMACKAGHLSTGSSEKSRVKMLLLDLMSKAVVSASGKVDTSLLSYTFIPYVSSQIVSLIQT